MTAALSLSLASAQSGGQAPQQGAPPAGGGNTPTRPTPTPTPTPSPREPRQPQFPGERERTPFPEAQRPIFLSGKVMLDDGTPPPQRIVIEMVCNGNHRPEAYTDSKGRFHFQVGANRNMIPDASVSSAASNDPFGSGGFGRSSSQAGPMGSEMALMGCELRASLPGYRSDVVNLAGRRMLDNPDVGTIVLHRLGEVEGTTISITDMQAPKDAKKAYEKGHKAIGKKKWDEAKKELEKAVGLYPEYATAWYELGLTHQQLKNAEEAKQAFSKALEADAKFVKPYMQLATMAAQQQNWQEVADTTDRMLRLDRFSYPEAHFYNSIANFNLQKLDAAEKSARETLRMDTDKRIPKANHLLGVILANKHDYAGAAEQMKAYLERSPNAPDAEAVKKQLVQIEAAMGGGSQAQK